VHVHRSIHAYPYDKSTIGWILIQHSGIAKLNYLCFLFSLVQPVTIYSVDVPTEIEFDLLYAWCFMQVIFTEENRSFLHYLTNLCAIVGGMTTISILCINSFYYYVLYHVKDYYPLHPLLNDAPVYFWMLNFIFDQVFCKMVPPLSIPIYLVQKTVLYLQSIGILYNFLLNCFYAELSMSNLVCRWLTDLFSAWSSGIFTVSGIIDSFIYHGQKALKKKMEIGKYR
jgi:hypothetical protein